MKAVVKNSAEFKNLSDVCVHRPFYNLGLALSVELLNVSFGCRRRLSIAFKTCT